MVLCLFAYLHSAQTANTWTNKEIVVQASNVLILVLLFPCHWVINLGLCLPHIGYLFTNSSCYFCNEFTCSIVQLLLCMNKGLKSGSNAFCFVFCISSVIPPFWPIDVIRIEFREALSQTSTNSLLNYSSKKKKAPCLWLAN